jgi:2-polyprenyl-3-methyl-5-hydroxy-6-metoxy-1,4-benzoquinol methylase
MREHGIAATGIDTDERVIGKPHLRQESMFDTDDSAEVVVCLEVAEHVAVEQADAVAASVAGALAPGGTLIWSAAQPGQSGTGHINCQPKAYWHQRLSVCGLRRDEATEAQLVDYAKSGYHMGWFANNAMVFRRAT